MNTAQSSENGDFGFQIAPMVDVVFVLLLFFMACAGLSSREGTLSVDLRHGPGFEVPILIDIDATGGIYVGGQFKGGGADHDLAALHGVLEENAKGSRDPIIIRPAMATAHEHVIDVLNACKKAKLTKIAFQ